MSDPIADLLAQEHAAVYLYGRLTPLLPVALRADARAAYEDHRRHRDALLDLLGGSAPAALTSYALPGPDALASLLVAETSLTRRWHDAVSLVDRESRRLCATALVDEARHSALLSYAQRPDLATATEPFPGRF